MKRAILIHGWGGRPEHGWFPWLTRELEKEGFAVSAPLMPDTDEPTIERWVPAVRDAVGSPDADTYLVGHSMGCEAIARYLESLPEDVEVGGVVFVAGFFKSLTLDASENHAIWEAWRTAPIDLAKVRARAPKSIAIFSDNDPYVPLENVDDFRDSLGSQIIVEHDKLHFSGDQGCTELPLALESLRKLAS